VSAKGALHLGLYFGRVKAEAKRFPTLVSHEQQSMKSAAKPLKRNEIYWNFVKEASLFSGEYRVKE